MGGPGTQRGEARWSWRDEKKSGLKSFFPESEARSLLPADKFPNRFDALLSSYGFSKRESVGGADTAACIKTVCLF